MTEVAHKEGLRSTGVRLMFIVTQKKPTGEQPYLLTEHIKESEEGRRDHDDVIQGLQGIMVFFQPLLHRLHLLIELLREPDTRAVQYCGCSPESYSNTA